MFRKKQAGTKTSILAGGWIFLLIAFLLLFASWNTGANLLYLITGAVINFILLSLLISRWNLWRIQLHRTAPSAVPRGESFSVLLHLENRRPFTPSFGITVREGRSRDASLGYFFQLPAQWAIEGNTEYQLEERGIHSLPSFRICTAFPFGLFECSRLLTDDLEIVVYPRVRPVRTSVIDRFRGAAAATQQVSSDGDEFFGLREYMPGDELRHIAWRLSARMGIWMVREMSRENSRDIMLVFDTRRGDFSAQGLVDFEALVDLVASLAVSLLERQYRVGLFTPEGELEGAEGGGQVRKVLHLMARLGMQGDAPWPDLQKSLARYQNQSMRVLVIAVNRESGSYSHGQVKELDPREVHYV